MNIKNLIDEINLELEELPDSYSDLRRDFNECVSEENYRAAFYPLYKITHLPDWSPSKKLIDLVEKFKVVF